MAATLHPEPPQLPRQPIPPQEYIVPCQAVWGHQQIQAPPQKPTPRLFNSAHSHPVFFTDKLRRPPFTMGPGPQLNPVAHGYVYQDAPQRGNAKSNGSRL
ncbi:hypothetical protein QBC42DRAFT_265068 [Cladorrhinum samala]|uniref:Uncharacterized protein n=1 Tax=Cladorrhinum samala TaxID=585594 RepID=A0AAV9HW68_9PEZI|nr:hypothetical protein QBC42DRAFT_265068 [Cladorrhinum samala]